MTFRFILQPVLALIAALPDGIRNAREGHKALFWTALWNPAHQGGRLREGLTSVARVVSRVHRKTTLYVNDRIVAQGEMKTQPGKFTLSGDGLCIGRDSGDAVSEEYTTPAEFKGGTIKFAGVTVEKAQHLDLEKLAHAALAVD